MRLTWPVRMITIGATGTGKTSLLRLALLRGEFGKRTSLELTIMSPVEASVNQWIWKDLEEKGFILRRIICDKQVRDQAPFRAELKPGIRQLVIIDDVDLVSLMRVHVAVKGGICVQTGMAFLTNLFAVESHHADMGCILVSHGIKIGAPCICENADYILLTSLAPSGFAKVKKVLELTPNEISQITHEHTDPSGFVVESPTEQYDFSNGDQYKCFNHVVVVLRQVFEHDQKPIPRIWKFGKKVSSPGGLNPC